ncbi:hypothetical protein [Streptomyces alboflavus]|uniref:hypothetical protein n=1 Tax=Streptomyces alboflavus TaxID=67267 RepID=UPI0036A44793
MVLLNGQMRGDSGLWMSLAEAEQLHSELCRRLGNGHPHLDLVPGEPLPACREHG